MTRDVLISVLILSKGENNNLIKLLPETLSFLKEDHPSEILVVLPPTDKEDLEGRIDVSPYRLINDTGEGYGQAFRDGLSACEGEWIITLDGDYSHSPDLIPKFLENIERFDLVVGSRYVEAGSADMPHTRLLLSRILNFLFRTALRTEIKDISSGYRMYRRSAIADIPLQGRHFEILIEVLAALLKNGASSHEIALNYRARQQGVSKAQLVRFGVAYSRLLCSLCYWWLFSKKE